MRMLFTMCCLGNESALQCSKESSRQNEEAHYQFGSINLRSSIATCTCVIMRTTELEHLIVLVAMVMEIV